MKITVETIEALPETEVVVRCAAIDAHIRSIVASLRMHDQHVVGISEGASVIVPAGDILYIESVEGCTFAYTADLVLEVRARISALEESLAENGFVRAAKSCLVNLCRISSLRPYVGGRLLARLDNQEQIVISRKYAHAIKQQLGV